MKIISVYRNDNGIVLDVREDDSKIERVFDTQEEMLKELDVFKFHGVIDQYQLNISNEFWAMVINFINTGEMPSSHGGKREGAGRPALGTTRKVSITLPDEEWKALETAKGGLSMSAYLREIIKGRN
ncbi:hypothetical protein [Campylobacter sp. 1]|uniref:hypothetical protein n=1 Tax=Campylobacter sp. 1 TaxID=2039344 RepID=UPI001C5EA44D|nr:hypothetical protein [Campylobacter sp. 1]